MFLGKPQVGAAIPSPSDPVSSPTGAVVASELRCQCLKTLPRVDFKNSQSYKRSCSKSNQTDKPKYEHKQKFLSAFPVTWAVKHLDIHRYSVPRPSLSMRRVQRKEEMGTALIES